MEKLNKDKYIVIKEIGRGTFGVAVKAQCKRTGMIVVIKMIDCTRLTPRQENDAVNELNVLRQLRHPYIVTHKDSFTDFGQLSIVMEYATGGDLFSRIQSRNGLRFEESQISAWFLQMCLGVSYIHSKNVMHRDLKPQNLFLTADGKGGEKILIGDFGVCKIMRSPSDLTTTVTGTPYYLAPEVFQNKPYSIKSDIWSLGCILYEMAALCVPFDAKDLTSLGQKVTRGPNPIFPTYCSIPLRDVFIATMRRDYRSRPFAEELLEFPHLVQIARPPLGVVNSYIGPVGRFSPVRSPSARTASPIGHKAKPADPVRRSSPLNRAGALVRGASPIGKIAKPDALARGPSPIKRASALIRGASPIGRITERAPPVQGVSPIGQKTERAPPVRVFSPIGGKAERAPPVRGVSPIRHIPERTPPIGNPSPIGRKGERILPVRGSSPIGRISERASSVRGPSPTGVPCGVTKHVQSSSPSTASAHVSRSILGRVAALIRGPSPKPAPARESVVKRVVTSARAPFRTGSPVRILTYSPLRRRLN